MEELSIRARLTSFRVAAFSSDNAAEGNGSPWKLELQQDIEVGLEIPTRQESPLQAVVRLELRANARNESDGQQSATFRGEYLARFSFPPGVTQAAAARLIEQEPCQYLLVAQAYPLAMTHFRRELQATGFDARQLPLGI